jgi:hypothetical protein
LVCTVLLELGPCLRFWIGENVLKLLWLNGAWKRLVRVIGTQKALMLYLWLYLPKNFDV